MKKVSLIVCLLLVVMMVFSACDNGEASSTVSSSSSTASVSSTASSGETEISGTLSLMWWGNATRTELTQTALELYKDENPNVDFEYSFNSFTDYWTEMTTAGLSNDLPDIVQQDYAKLNYWTAIVDTLVDHNQYVGNDLDVSNFTESILASGTINNKLYAIPTGTNALAYLYSAEDVSAAGIGNLVKDDWTKKDFFDACKKVMETTPDVKSPYLVSSDPKFYMEAVYVRTAGDELFSADANGFGFSDVEGTFKKTFQDQLDLVNDYGAVAFADTQTTGIDTDPLVLGITWGNFYWSNQMTAVYEAGAQVNRAFEITFVPEGKNGGVYLKPAMFWAVTRDAVSRGTDKMAANLISFFVNSTEVNKVFNGDRGIPCSSLVREELHSEGLTELNSKIYEFIDKVAEVATPIGPAEPTWASEFTAKFKTLFEEVILKTKTPDEAVSALMSACEEFVPDMKP